MARTRVRMQVLVLTTVRPHDSDIVFTSFLLAVETTFGRTVGLVAHSALPLEDFEHALDVHARARAVSPIGGGKCECWNSDAGGVAVDTLLRQRCPRGECPTAPTQSSAITSSVPTWWDALGCRGSSKVCV